jgi:coproporphyrinogen III oxidase-like Fe-S oxidoreductase
MAKAGYTTVSAYSAVKDPEAHRHEYENHMWKGGDVIGLGLGAYGYAQGVHYQNETSLLAYSNAIHERRLPIKRSYPLSARDQAIREFVLQAKSGCVERQALSDRHGVDVVTEMGGALSDLAEKGMLAVTPTAVKLTDRGRLRVDWLSPTFFDLPFKPA